MTNLINLKLLNLSCLCLLLLSGVFFSPSSSAVERTIYFHNDLNGSPVAITDDEGDVIWRESYKPYGERLTKQEGTESHTSWYTGKTEEAAFGIQYFGGRWYHQKSGRFMTFDPASARENIANPLMFNRYIYANNNPYRYVDPDGNSPLDIGFFVVDGFRLGLAIYGGDKAAIQSATADFAASTLGLVSPVPGVGQAIKAGRAGVKIAKVTKNADGLIYRGGSRTSTNLTPRAKDVEGLSANVNPLPGKNQVIDTSKLDKLCAVCDNPKTGHVSIRPKDQSQMQSWIDSRGSDTTHPLTQELQNAIVDQVKK